MDVPQMGTVYSGQVLHEGFLMPLLCARPLHLFWRMNHSPRLEKQWVKCKQMDPAILRKASECCRLSSSSRHGGQRAEPAVPLPSSSQSLCFGRKGLLSEFAQEQKRFNFI